MELEPINHSEETPQPMCWYSTIMCSSDESVTSNCVRINVKGKTMGILDLPGVPVHSRWLLGKILCIEHSGGSSALVFTQSTRARPGITK